MFKPVLLFFLLPLVGLGQLNMLVDEWKKDKALKNASIGFCITNAKTGETLSEYNSHQLLVPASTLKIVTTSAALNLLGANYRYETKLYFTGNFDKASGILTGDIIILGSGDPTLQSENFYNPNEPVTDKWAAVLREKGLKELKGNIIGDASCFDRLIPGNWIWEDISNYYGAGPCGLSYADNKFKLFYTSQETGSRAKIISTSPTYLTNTITLISDVTAKGTEDKAFAYGDPYSFTKEIHGTIPPNKTNYEVEVVLPDPALLCAESLYNSLIKTGIKCGATAPRSSYLKKDEQPQKLLVHTHYSPTLDRIVFYTNLKSNNHYSETLLRTIGKGNLSGGLSSVKKYCSKNGLDTGEVYMEDGCGLSRINTITTSFQTMLLTQIYKDSVLYKPFNASLPVAGKHGSMSSLGKGTFIENNLRAKTGYITRVRSYCGYLKSASGKELAFSVIFNNYNCSPREAKIKIEKFLVALGEL